MKKVLIAVLLFMIIALPSAFAEFRLDIALDIPYKMGAVFSDLGVTEEVNILENFTFLFPEVTGSFMGSFGPVNLGVGLRMFTLILESVAWPVVYAELDFDRLAIYGNIGGGGFLLFGLYNSFETAQLVLPDISAWFKFSDTFRVGLGGMGFFHPDLGTDNFGYTVYLSGRWSILF